MLGFGLYTSSAILFIIIIAVLLFRDRRNVRREGGIFFLRRTQRGKKFLTSLGSRHKKFWKQLGNIAILSGFVMSVWMTWMMAVQLQLIASGAVPKEASGGILLPSLTGEPMLGRGFILVPFWYYIIALSVILVAHEGMHAMLGITAKVKLKSIGWGLLAVLPLGFVEPDEKQVEKKKSMEQLRFFAAGSFGNFIVAGVSLLLLAFAFNPMFASNGVFYRALVAGHPAEQANMTGYIIGIDGYAINSTENLSKALEIIGPNKTVAITTVNITENGSEGLKFTLETVPEPEPQFKPGIFTGAFALLEYMIPGAIDFAANPLWAPQKRDWYSIKHDISMWTYLGNSYPALRQRAIDNIEFLQAKLLQHPRRGYIGIAYTGNVQGLKPGYEAFSESISFFGGLLYWLFLLNFGVGAFNLLPMKPLDGERMWRLVLQRFAKKKAAKIMNYVSIAILFLILAFFALVML